MRSMPGAVAHVYSNTNLLCFLFIYSKPFLLLISVLRAQNVRTKYFSKISIFYLGIDHDGYQNIKKFLILNQLLILLGFY